MKRITLALLASAAVLISACGTRPDDSSGCGAAVYDASGQVIGSCDSPLAGAALPVILNVRAISDANDISTGGTETATITALITDDANRAVAGSAIVFSSNGGVLQNMSTETDENGEASAELTLAGDYRNQNIMVNVVSGASTGQVLISASGTEVDVSGPSALVLGDSAELTVTLTAGNGEPIANEELLFTSTANNTISPTTAVTDSEGRVIINVSSDSGDDTISVSALEGTVLGSHELNVAEDLLSFSSPADGAELSVGGLHTIEVVWISEGQPVIGEDLRFGITAGQIASSSTLVTTDGSGRASIQVSSNSAGPATVTVASAETGDPATQHDIEFIAITPANLSLSSSSTRVATSDTSAITALVTDVNGNPVKNQEVVFYSADLKGGQLNPASAVTNSEGEAAVTFTAGNLATEFKDVVIEADVGGMSISGLTELTVVERVLNITLGTSNLLDVIAGETQYGLPFAVQVADGGGTPLENATVEVSITPLQYLKGVLGEGTDSNGNAVWTQYVSANCESEDLNGNRLLDAGEDVNNNGVLDPQDPALIAAHATFTPTVVGGAISTDSNGSGYFELVYPASSSMWSKVRITARAKALGVEAEEVFDTWLQVLNERVDDISDSPPNVISPYGTSGLCSDEL